VREPDEKQDRAEHAAKQNGPAEPRRVARGQAGSGTTQLRTQTQDDRKADSRAGIQESREQMRRHFPEQCLGRGGTDAEQNGSCFPRPKPKDWMEDEVDSSGENPPMSITDCSAEVGVALSGELAVSRLLRKRSAA